MLQFNLSIHPHVTLQSIHPSHHVTPPSIYTSIPSRNSVHCYKKWATGVAISSIVTSQSVQPSLCSLYWRRVVRVHTWCAPMLSRNDYWATPSWTHLSYIPEPNGPKHHSPEANGDENHSPEPNGHNNHSLEPNGYSDQSPKPNVHSIEPNGRSYHSPDPNGQNNHSCEPNGQSNHSPEPNEHRNHHWTWRKMDVKQKKILQEILQQHCLLLIIFICKHGSGLRRSFVRSFPIVVAHLFSWLYFT